jgi:hypothetical protein
VSRPVPDVPALIPAGQLHAGDAITIGRNRRQGPAIVRSIATEPTRRVLYLEASGQSGRTFPVEYEDGEVVERLHEAGRVA